MRWIIPTCLLLAVGLMTLLGACQKTSSAESEFAPGAFPPTLSNKDYHQKSWQREDCLTCHEKGVNDAPAVKHVSVSKLAKGAKCRTCHVTASGSDQG